MEKGFIRKSNSPFSSPVLIVPKPRNADGTSRGFRLVTDFRALNEIAEPHQHPIPEVGEMYAKLRHAKYISTLDLKNGYWNAGLDEESKPLTAFATEYGCYEYNTTGTADTVQKDTKRAHETESGTGSNTGGRPSKKNRKTPADNSHATNLMKIKILVPVHPVQHQKVQSSMNMDATQE
eukprot:SAG11_NODE_1316_length_5219_cov_47.375708_5_plen_179_part_00